MLEFPEFSLWGRGGSKGGPEVMNAYVLFDFICIVQVKWDLLERIKVQFFFTGRKYFFYIWVRKGLYRKIIEGATLMKPLT